MTRLARMKDGGTASALATRIALTIAVCAAVAGCRDELGSNFAPEVAPVADYSERHPIAVTQSPSELALHVSRSAPGLNPTQRSRVVSFLHHYRTQDSGNSRITLKTPGGTANEVAAMQAVNEVRLVAEDMGIDPSTIVVESYLDTRSAQPPVHLSYTRYVAHGPQCGNWPSNLAIDPHNLPYHNFGCANQANFAAMIANPADLIGPRTMTPRSGEIRDGVWGKLTKGESTVSEKAEDEKVIKDK